MLAGDKGTGKKPEPKKAAKPSNEDQLRQELELLQKVQPEGWILLDFPRTLQQSKLIEQFVTGYKCLLDQEKPQESKQTEAWQKLMAPENIIPEDYNGVPSLQQSVFDGVIMLDVQTSECQRRSQNRKLDPQTGTIYHLEDNPPPEGDNKLRDRLQDYTDPESDLQKLKSNHINFEYQEKPLEKWMSSFGLSNENQTAVILLKKVTIADKKSKEEVYKEVMGQIDKIMAFKQEVFDNNKQRIKNSLDSAEQQQQEEDKEGEQVEQQELVDLPEQTQSYDNRELVSQHSKLSKTQKSQKSFQRKATILGDQDKKEVWNDFVKNYYCDALEVFRTIRKQKDQVCEGLNEIQSQFINFLQRSDAKQSKINHFIDSFNKFSEEFPDLREDEQTKQELVSRVDQLSNDLWAIIEQRKDEALLEHQRIVGKGWIELEMKKLIMFGTKIVQAELAKYVTAYQIVTSVSPQEMMIHVEEEFNVLLNQGHELFDRLVASVNKQHGSLQQKDQIMSSEKSSPILNQLFTKILNQLEQHANSEVALLDEKDREIMQTEQTCLIFRMNQIKTWLQLKLQEFQANSSKVFQAMDDWIVVAVQKENSQSQEIVDQLRQAIYEQTMRLEYHSLLLDDLQLYTDITILEFHSSDQPLYMQEVSAPKDINDIRFKVTNLELLYKQFRYLAYEECIDEHTFLHVMVLAYQQDRIPKQWRSKDFIYIVNLAKKFRVDYDGSPKKQKEKERMFVNWKLILTIFLLLECDASREQLEEYVQRLKEVDPEVVALELIQSEKAWFDDQIGIPEAKAVVASDFQEDEFEEMSVEADYTRIAEIKTLLHHALIRSTGVLHLADLEEALEQLTRKADGGKYSTLIFDH